MPSSRSRPAGRRDVLEKVEQRGLALWTRGQEICWSLYSGESKVLDAVGEMGVMNETPRDLTASSQRPPNQSFRRYSSQRRLATLRKQFKLQEGKGVVMGVVMPDSAEEKEDTHTDGRGGGDSAWFNDFTHVDMSTT